VDAAFTSYFTFQTHCIWLACFILQFVTATCRDSIRYSNRHFILFQVWLRDIPRTGVRAGVGVEGENIKEEDDRGGYKQKQKQKAKKEADVL
jgi:hypothetical protein